MLPSTYWSLSCGPQAEQKNPPKWETHAPQLKLSSRLPPTREYRCCVQQRRPSTAKTNFKMTEVGHLDSHTRRNEAGAWSYTVLTKFNLKPIKDLNVKNWGCNIHGRKPTKASQHRSLSWFFWSDNRSRYKQMGQRQTKKKKKKNCSAQQRKWNWKWKSLSCVRLFATPWSIYSLGNFPGQNSGVGSPSLLQGIFPTQESNPGLPHCRQILYQLSHQGSPRILEWVAIAFPGDLPNPGIRLRSPALQTDSLQAEPQKTTIKTGNLVQRGKKNVICKLYVW